MILGTAVGDALGMPVETWSRDRIRDEFPEGIKQYYEPSGHKWFNGHPAGSWTDDTQLTLATLRGFVRARRLDLQAQARAMVEAMQEASAGQPTGGSGVPGWGYTTVKAVRNLANNVPWWLSGKTDDPNLGHGNGVVMRQSPIAAWMLSPVGSEEEPLEDHEALPIHQQLVNFSAMTHYTQQSAISTVVHNAVLTYCLNTSPKDFKVEDCFDNNFQYLQFCLKSKPTDGVYDWWIGHLNATEIDMWQEFQKVLDSSSWDSDKIIEQFGGGSCNVGHSLPFCYAFFAQDHNSHEVISRVIESGGDTDTNGSIVGAMLGALHGEEIFPESWVKNLYKVDEIIKITERFCDYLRI
jgi:ADP-ribosylglycohydrolase